MATTFKIHPAIGFARLGNSPESYPGPTIPGVTARPEKYRDGELRLKRQAAGFWVYAYDDANTSGPVLVAAGPGKRVTAIEWTVHLANKKASWFNFDGLTGSRDVLNPPLFGYPAGSLRNTTPPLTDPDARRKQWVIDPGPRTVGTPGTSVEFQKGGGGGFPETWPGPFLNGNSPGIDTLGLMQLQPDFSLTVVGGSGNSGSINNSSIVNYANNPGWFDDSSDGPVTATLILNDGSRVEAAPAWIVVGPPDFAPPIDNIVTMYDAIYDVGLRSLGYDPSIYDVAGSKFLDGFAPSFESDIYPILRRAFMYRWVYNEDTPNPPTFHATLNNLVALSTPPSGGNDPNAGKRNAIFRRLRAPTQTTDQFDSGKMPKVYGDNGDGPNGNGLTLTVTQYEIMRRWEKGQFTRGNGPIPPPIPTTVTSSGLDRAVLEACVGGAFFPGIECGWIVREPRFYLTPFEFRFRHAVNENDVTGLSPGDVTKRSACPWQADFYQCNNNWWPAQRPNQVRRSATGDYVNWDDNIVDDMGMVQNWHDLGIVVKDAHADNYYEDERRLPPHP
jgi:L-lysine epsilon oxidase-like protein